MVSAESLSSAAGLRELFSDYLACKIYLGRIQNGSLKVSPGIQLSVSRRLEFIHISIRSIARRKFPKDIISDELVRQAALHFLTRQALDPEQYLKRLAIR